MKNLIVGKRYLFYRKSPYDENSFRANFKIKRGETLHRLKRKMRQKFLKNINKTVSFHYSVVKAPRRALNYLTISTFYRRNG
jgi:hypothetical protein